MPGDSAAAAEPQPAYNPGNQKQAGPSGYRYDENWGQEQQQWYRPQAAAAAGGQQQALGPAGAHQRPNAVAQRRRDNKQQAGQANRRQQKPQQYNADYYDDYDTAEGSGFSLMEYVPQGLRRVFSGMSSWMSRMDGGTVAAGALTAFALGVAAAMGTAGLSGVAFTGRKFAERFDLSWDKFKEIQNLEAIDRALDFLEIEDEVCRQKAVCEVEQKVAMKNVFLWYTMRAVSGYIPGMDKYQEAALMALEGHSCQDVYPQCPASVVERIAQLSWTDFLPSDSQLKKLAGLLSHKVKSYGVPTNLNEVAKHLETRYGLVVKPDTMKNIARELVFYWNKNRKNL